MDIINSEKGYICDSFECRISIKEFRMLKKRNKGNHRGIAPTEKIDLPWPLLGKEGKSNRGNFKRGMTN